MATRLQKIFTCLAFNDNAEQAVDFYLSVFKDGKIFNVNRYAANDPGPEGTVVAIHFELFGQPFLAINGGPHFKFTQAISLCVNCDNQEEIDRLWDALSASGKKMECGWVSDQFGVSWQIVPTILGELLDDADPAAASRVLKAVWKMQKLDIAAMQKAKRGP